MSFIRRLIVVAVVAGSLCLPVVATGATWTTYVGPSATFRQPGLGGPTQGQSGYNNFNYNRVYRPTPHPFILDYDNGTYHYSATNWDTNPFYFNPSGYNWCGCLWVFSSDSAGVLYPITCQAGV